MFPTNQTFLTIHTCTFFLNTVHLLPNPVPPPYNFTCHLLRRLDILACRAAPIQVTWIGYPNTTGLDYVHYRVTDALTDPPNTTQPFSVFTPTPCGGDSSSISSMSTSGNSRMTSSGMSSSRSISSGSLQPGVSREMLSLSLRTLYPNAVTPARRFLAPHPVCFCYGRFATTLFSSAVSPLFFTCERFCLSLP